MSFSRPEGRVRVFFPDNISWEDLRSILNVNLGVVIAAQSSDHNPPKITDKQEKE